MCGICGFNWEDSNLLGLLKDELKHRGPDDDGSYQDEHLSIGHCRLSIIDLSERGRQPISNEDGNVLVAFNGEIYNYKELRRLLEDRNHVFYSNTDTEVIVHTYEEFGLDFTAHFNGMWAFCLYDKAKRVLILSRDRFGIKPLYYYHDPKEKMLIFASELRPFLRLRDVISIKPSKRAIHDYWYLNLVNHGSFTFFHPIKQVKPAHNIVYDLKNNTIVKYYQYWSLTDYIQQHSSKITLKEALDQLKRILIDSIRLRLRSDVEVGSCLSGGLDSSTIVSLMAQVGNREKINTFSAVYGKGEVEDESEYILALVNRLQVKSHLVRPTLEGFIKDLPDVIQTQEEPFLSTSIYAQYKVMNLAKQANVKVLLDGQGADELFGGYFNYYHIRYAELLCTLNLAEYLAEWRAYHHLYPQKSLRMTFKSFYHCLPASIKEQIRWNSVIPVEASSNPLQFTYHSREVVKKWLHTRYLQHYLIQEVTRTRLPALLRYEDKNSMRFSIETRVPFLDYRLVQLAFVIPSSLKIYRAITKYILRKMGAEYEILPTLIYSRRDKIGFATPEGKWFRHPDFRHFAFDLFEQNRHLGDHQIIDSQKAKKILKRYYTQKERGMHKMLWKMINLYLWYTHFFQI